MYIPPEIVRDLNESPIEEVAAKLGIVVRSHKAICFAHDDHKPSLSFNVSKNLFRCWACGVSGDPIKLVREKEGLDFQEACVWLAKEYGVNLANADGCIKPLKKSVKESTLLKKPTYYSFFDEEVATWLINNAGLSEEATSFLYKERHYKSAVIENLNIKSVSSSERVLSALLKRFGVERCVNSGFVKRGKYGLYFCFPTPCLLFPYYESNGELIGIQSRYLGNSSKAPRFQFLASQKTRLYNLPILNSLMQGDKLYISEGITDCIALLSSDLNAVAIPSATILPSEDLAMLTDYELHMYPDMDEAGEKACWELKKFFANHCITVTAEVLPKGVKDYSDYYLNIGTDGRESR